jgi:hypothetical protein
MLTSIAGMVFVPQNYAAVSNKVGLRDLYPCCSGSQGRTDLFGGDLNNKIGLTPNSTATKNRSQIQSRLLSAFAAAVLLLRD